jgi:hypothetical protein
MLYHTSTYFVVLTVNLYLVYDVPCNVYKDIKDGAVNIDSGKKAHIFGVNA